jgi:hypothetical protein
VTLNPRAGEDLLPELETSAMNSKGIQEMSSAPTSAKTNAMAIVSLVTSILGISLVGVITGHIAMSQIKKTGEQGNGLAVAGLIIGYIGTVTWVLLWAFFGTLFLVALGLSGA